jgi:uncharacterized protein YndB with AHSA1/START domain
MTVKNVTKDPENLTLTVTAEFRAPIERVWQLWADPRQLERWWGPPTYPATVVDHDLVPGGSIRYYMTGPEGGKYHGWWNVLAVDPPRSLRVEDGFGDDSGAPNPKMPVVVIDVALSESGGLTQMVSVTTFPSPEAMEQLVQMGMEEGMLAAMAQMDDVLSV